MSSLTTTLSPVRSEEPIFPLSVEQYHQMIDDGVLTEDDPVELIEGVLVYKRPKKPKHGYVIRVLAKALEELLPFLRAAAGSNHIEQERVGAGSGDCTWWDPRLGGSTPRTCGRSNRH